MRAGGNPGGMVACQPSTSVGGDAEARFQDPTNTPGYNPALTGSCPCGDDIFGRTPSCQYPDPSKPSSVTPGQDHESVTQPAEAPPNGPPQSTRSGSGTRLSPFLVRGDLVAGLVLAALLVPQGMAYSELAGLPAVYGLYATMVPLIVYSLLGPSRILILGPDSAIAPVVAAAIIPIAGNNTSERVALAGMLAVLVGLFCFIGGIAGLGFVTDLISKPVRLGYLAGIAISVIISQLPGLLGFSVNGSGLWDDLRGLVTNLDQTDIATLLIGGGSLAFMLLVRIFEPRVPGALIVVVVSSLLVTFLDLTIDTIGAIPQGLPGFVIPDPGVSDLQRLALTALALSLLAFADTSVLSRSYATRRGDHVDQNQELRALGAANLATGFFQGFPISSSSSRTPVAEAAGSKSQLTGLIGALSLGGILLFANEMFRNLPATVLAAIVIAAMVGLIDIAQFRRLAHVHRTDFLLALSCFLGVAVFGVLSGMGVAIGLSLVSFLWRMWHPHDAVLGRATGVKGYHDLTRYPDAKEIPGLLLFRFDAPVFFANSGVFRERLLAAVDASDVPLTQVVVAAEPITDLDSTATDMLAELADDLASRGIDLAFAEMKDPVKDRLGRFGLVETIGHHHFYPTIGVAVKTFVNDHDVEWTDWEDAREKAAESKRRHRNPNPTQPRVRRRVAPSPATASAAPSPRPTVAFRNERQRRAPTAAKRYRWRC